MVLWDVTGVRATQLRAEDEKLNSSFFEDSRERFKLHFGVMQTLFYLFKLETKK